MIIQNLLRTTKHIFRRFNLILRTLKYSHTAPEEHRYTTLVIIGSAPIQVPLGTFIGLLYTYCSQKP